MLRSGDPLRDFALWDAEEAENEKLFPICDCCGDRITSETYISIRYMKKDIKVCNDCAEKCYTEDYVEEMKYGY